MKADDVIEAFERFFLDLIGTIIPGFAFLIGFCYVRGKPLFDISQTLFGHSTDYEWVFLVGLAYILGHAIASMGFKIIRKIEFAYLSEGVREALLYGQKDWILGFVSPESELEKRLAEDPIYKAFIDCVIKRIPTISSEAKGITKPRTWRNMALSIAPEQNQLVYRFTFIALLNLGISTVSISLFGAWIIMFCLKGLGLDIAVINLNFLAFAFFVAPYFFLERYYNFNKRAFQVPFSMALAKLGDQLAEQAGKTSDVRNLFAMPENGVANRRKLYLAGGFQSGWQDRVKTISDFEYFDPRLHGLKNKAEYTVWDLEAIRKSDIVFAYLESTNPGGYALALEVGFAKALNKFVIFVDEKSALNEPTSRYLEMLAAASDVSFKTFAEGIQFLKKYRELK